MHFAQVSTCARGYHALVWACTLPRTIKVAMMPDRIEREITIVESGFASLVIPPARHDAASHESHSAGWTEALQALRQHAEQFDQ